MSPLPLIHICLSYFLAPVIPYGIRSPVSPSPVPSECLSCGPSSAPSALLSGQSTFYQFDTITAQFLDREQPFTSVDQACIVGDASRFAYLIGGFQSFDNCNGTTTASNLLQRFDGDPEVLEWTTLSATLNIARAYPTCHHFTRRNAAGILFVISGIDTNSNYLDNIEYLDLERIELGWILLDALEYKLKHPRISAKTVTDAFDNIWIMGGFDGTHTLRSIESIQVRATESNGSESNISVSISNNFGNLAVSRAAMVVGQYALDSGYSCVIAIGGRSGVTNDVNVMNDTGLKTLGTIDKVEYLCYESPDAVGCFEKMVLNVGKTWLDSCENDAWLVNVNDVHASVYTCDYHAIMYYTDSDVQPGVMEVTNTPTCYHGPFGLGTQNLTRMFEIDGDSGNGTSEGNARNIGISFRYYTFCAFDSNQGDFVSVYLNGNELLWSGTHALNDCNGPGGWESFNWTDSFVTRHPYLHRCVDDGNSVANLDDLACVADVVVNVTHYKNDLFDLTISGSVNERREAKNWGYSNLQIYVSSSNA